MNKLISIIITAFYFPIASSQEINVVSPNTGYLGDLLEVSITGVSTHFKQATNLYLYFNQQSSTLYVDEIKTEKDDFLKAKVWLYRNVLTGNYNITLYNNIDGEIFAENVFEIMEDPTPPEILNVTPNNINKGEKAVLTINTSEAHFKQASSTIWGYLSNSNHEKEINFKDIVPINDNQIEAEVYFPNYYDTGQYNLHIGNILDGMLVFDDAIKVEPNPDPPFIKLVQPDSAMIGTEVSVSITGTNFNFSQASNTNYFYFKQGSSTIRPYRVNTINDSILEADFFIKNSVPPGNYDVSLSYNYNDYLILENGIYLKENAFPPSIKYIKPNILFLNQEANVFISGTNTHFSQATHTTRVKFRQGTSTIYANNINTYSDSTIKAEFYLYDFYPTGLYDVEIYNYYDGYLNKKEGINIVQTNIMPEIADIYPKSIYLNEETNVEITGLNTHFKQASNSSVWFSQASNTLYINGFEVGNDQKLTIPHLNLPRDTFGTGIAELYIENELDGVLKYDKGMFINKDACRELDTLPDKIEKCKPDMLLINTKEGRYKLNDTLTGYDTMIGYDDNNTGFVEFIVEKDNCKINRKTEIMVYPFQKLDLGEDIKYAREGETIELKIPDGYSDAVWPQENEIHENSIFVNKSGSYSVWATDDYGCVSADSITVLFTTGIENNLDGQIKLYPNPVKDIFSIRLDNVYLNIKAEIFNLAGSKVFYNEFESRDKLVIDITSNPKGEYLLKLSFDGHEQVARIVKQ